jgi:DNA-binding transcriptional LysR family regulator
LGSRLFVRTASGLKLSEEGRSLAEHTEVIWNAGERIVSGFSPSSDRDRIRLEIGIARTITHVFASRTMHPLFLDAKVLVSGRHGDLPDLLRRLRSNELDMVLCDTAVPNGDKNDLHVEPVGKSPLLAVASRGVCDQVGDDLSKLAEVPFVHYTPVCTLRWPVEAFLSEKNLGPNIQAEVDDVSLMCEITSSAQAWSIVPLMAPLHALSSGELRILTRLGSEYVAEMYAVFKQESRAELVRAAVGRLQRSFASALKH